MKKIFLCLIIAVIAVMIYSMSSIDIDKEQLLYGYQSTFSSTQLKTQFTKFTVDDITYDASGDFSKLFVDYAKSIFKFMSENDFRYDNVITADGSRITCKNALSDPDTEDTPLTYPTVDHLLSGEKAKYGQWYITDCAAFVTECLDACGYRIGYQWGSCTFYENPHRWETIAFEDLQPGDILVYTNGGHVEIYIGDETSISAGSDFRIVDNIYKTFDREEWDAHNYIAYRPTWVRPGYESLRQTNTNGSD